MGQIITLDQNMINMIAAGEVIERPASIVKELMENSIDAGAEKITVLVEDGGRKLISVNDDGCGMDAEDLASAFESHTTSKIKTSKDLHNISTFGFRGEALASIASVSQLAAVSRTANSAEANSIEIDCGQKNAVTPCNADYGTSIRVRDIFYKLPARRKFLKTANTELGHITEQFIRTALANANLELTLSTNQRELYCLPLQQNIRQRIAALFSSEIAENLIETENDEKSLHIFALLGRPEISRTNGSLQYVFLNGRFIRDKFISHAVKEAYHGIIEPNRFPVVFLFIKMPYEDYDVNVHPTKIEVRFYNSNLVHSQILAVLREKLLGTDFETYAKLPTAGITKENTQDLPSKEFRNQKIVDAMADFFKKYKPVQSQQQQISFTHKTSEQPGKELHTKLYTLNAIQIHDSFIVAETDDGFIIIDQHALHERMMYEELRKRLSAGKLQSQKLLIPETFELTDAQADVAATHTELIEKLGIELAPFGPRAMAIQAFPSILSKTSPLDFVQDLIELLSEKTTSFDSEKLLDEVLNMAACKAAIKAGQKLTVNEMEQLLADREKIEYAGRCPHGRPTVIKFAVAELEKQFKRT
jgi:DNA mismatch repair protein MutL